MAKYIIDLDALYQCLDLMSKVEIDGRDFCSLQNVKAFIARFPKYKVQEWVNIELDTDIHLDKLK